MTAPNLLDELLKIVALSEKATPGKLVVSDEKAANEFGQPEYTLDVEPIDAGDVWVTDTATFYGDPHDANLCAASVNFLRTHAPALADMAKRMEAAERDAGRYRWLRVRLAGAAHVNELEEYNQTMHSGLASDVDAAIDATQEGEAS